MNRKKPAARHSREYWAAVVAHFESAPCRHKEFAARHGLNVGTFQTWLYKLRAEGAVAGSSLATSGGGFVQLVASNVESSGHLGCTVRVGEAAVHFESAPSAGYLAELLVRAGT